jgi:hypothetical protein
MIHVIYDPGICNLSEKTYAYRISSYMYMWNFLSRSVVTVALEFILTSYAEQQLNLYFRGQRLRPCLERSDVDLI